MSTMAIFDWQKKPGKILLESRIHINISIILNVSLRIFSLGFQYLPIYYWIYK